MARLVALAGNVTYKLALAIVDQINAYAEQSKEPIVMVIDSYGGCVNSMFTIHGAMVRSGCSFTTIILGKAMSAGLYLAMSGDDGRRFAMRNSLLMAHNPGGQVDVGNDSIEMMEWIAKIQLELLSARTKKPFEECKAMLNHDFYMTSETAVKLGIIDGIIG